MGREGRWDRHGFLEVGTGLHAEELPTALIGSSDPPLPHGQELRRIREAPDQEARRAIRLEPPEKSAPLLRETSLERFEHRGFVDRAVLQRERGGVEYVGRAP